MNFNEAAKKAFSEERELKTQADRIRGADGRFYDIEKQEASPNTLTKENIGTLDLSKLSRKENVNSTEKGKIEKEKKNVKEINTRNESLEGQKHPETGVPFERKKVENDKGEKVEGVFPEFESAKDVKLPKELEQATDAEQFRECNKQLKEAVNKDEKLKEKFDAEQLEQIENGDTPDGYTWHHAEERGKMQLVDSETHAKTGHTGGKVIWGGGSENR